MCMLSQSSNSHLLKTKGSKNQASKTYSIEEFYLEKIEIRVRWSELRYVWKLDFCLIALIT